MEITNLNKYGIDPNEISEYIKKAKTPNVSVSITGEFSSGKSTFLNALLNKKNFLSNENDECTPVFVEIVKGHSSNFEIAYKDGRKENVELNEENIKKYTTYKEGYDEQILGITLPVNSDYLKENISIIDTPGTNTIIKSHEEITEYILKKVDIVIYVLNKVVSQSDIKRLKEAYKYTKHLIVVITHMDEEIQGVWKNRGKEDIERLMEVAKKQIIGSFSELEYIEMFPVGSLAAYGYPEYIETIRNTINEYIAANNQNVLKNRVKSQLKIMFESKLKEIKDYIDTYEILKSNDIDEINNKIVILQNNLEKRENRNLEILEEMEITEEIIKKFNDKIIKLFKAEESKVIAKIISKENIEEEESNEIINGSLRNICNTVKRIIEDNISERIRMVFDESNEELNQILKDLNINMDSDAYLTKPTIEVIDDINIINKISKVREKSNKTLEEIAVTTAEVENSENITERIILKEEGIKCEFKELQNSKIEMGSYVPEYIENTDDDVSKMGAVTGRIIGEAIDIALLFIAPEKGLLKAADRAKDLSKVTKIIGNAAKKTTQVAGEVGKLKKKVQDPGILDTLKYLEVGFYGENFGRRIGSMIKPPRIILEEDEKNKASYMKRKNEVESKLNIKKDELMNIQQKLEESQISMGEYRKKKAELEAKVKNYENEEKILLNQLEQKRLKSSNDIIINYYKENIGILFDEEIKKITIMGTNILKNANKRLIDASTKELNKKIKSVQSTLEAMKNDKMQIENMIKYEKEKMEEIKCYDNWIEEWLN